MIRFSIVYPCFKERESLELLIHQLKDCIYRNDVEIIFVENGSSDGSREFLESQGAVYPWLKVVACITNSGYGGGILKGLEIAQGKYVGWSHADLQCCPADLFKAFEIIDSNEKAPPLFVKGRRYGRPAIDRFFTAGMSLMETILFRERLNDINAQPTLMDRKLYENWQNPPQDFSLDLYAFVQARYEKADVRRFPVMFGPRKFGHSSWNTGLRSRLNFIKRTLRFSIELKSRQ